MNWDGVERRRNAGCPLHEGLVDWVRDEQSERREGLKEVNSKLDKLIDNQALHHDEIMHIKSVVDDGLKSKVEEMAINMGNVYKKVTVLEDFKWFQDWITELRDHSFKLFLKFCLVGGGVYIAIHFGGIIATNVLKSLGG